MSRPWITLKWAQTLDGRLATATGHSRWISGPPARELAHRLRAEHDAILVGVGTVVADNPELTTRLVAGSNPTPVVLDSHLRTPLEASVLRPGTMIATTDGGHQEIADELRARGVGILRTPDRDGRVDLEVLMEMLHQRGFRRVLVEGGAAVLTAFLRLRMADEVVIVLAPRVAGAGIDAVADLGVTEMGSSIAFEEAVFSLSGEDAVFRGRPVWTR